MDKATKRALVNKYAAELEDVQNHPLCTQDIITWLAMCDTEEEMQKHVAVNKEKHAKRLAAQADLEAARKSRKRR